ncbi:hypothetical protein MRX96_043339 [Rhipicephalus microplus]
MLYTLGWWFAQQFSVMASLDGSIASYGSATTAAANRQSDCYALAESRFRRQLFLQRAHASLGYSGMRQVDDIFSNIRDTTVTLLRSLPWMDEAARNEAVAIVEATEFEVWRRNLGNHNDDDDIRERPPTMSIVGSRTSEAPQDNFSLASHTGTALGNRVVDARPKEYTAPTLKPMALRRRRRTSPSTWTVVQSWIDAAISYKRRLPNWPLDDTLLHRHLSYATLANYDYWWNSLFIQMGALAEPLFYLDGPVSANYGGIGVLVARHLFKAYDYMHGSQLDAKRRRRRWVSDSTSASYQRKLGCEGQSIKTMEHVAALEVAHAAAFGATGTDGKSLSRADANGADRLPGQWQALSPQMVFFLVYCHSTCESREGSGGLSGRRTVRCGDVLKRVASFGRAFGCPAGSPMTSSVPKCSFFAK